MELDKVLDAQARAWEQYKSVSDARIAAVEAKQSTADYDAKLEKINTALDELSTQAKAIQAAQGRTQGNESGNADVKAHSKAFNAFVRKGIGEHELRSLEQKAVSVGTAADGGYALPEEIDRNIGKTLQEISPMRQVANVIQVSTTDYKRLFDRNGIASGWVGETDARTATATSVLAEISAFMGEVYANPQATQTSLEDLFFNVESWLAQGVAEEFAKAEGTAFTSGNGTNKPKGVLAYTFASTDDASRTFGQFQYVPAGQAGDWAASNPADVLITLVYKMKAAHRRNAKWMINRALLAEIRKFKDANGQYLWQPSLSASQPQSLLGYEIVENEDMPAKAANSLSILFGDFKAGYTVVDRVGTSTLRDPFTNKPYVGFYTRKRVGGMAVDTDALKAIKFAAS